MNQLKTPPQSLDAEKSVLGSILLDPEGLIKIVDLIDHDDFYVPAHQYIYNSIFDLFNKFIFNDSKCKQTSRTSPAFKTGFVLTLIPFSSACF